MDDLKAVLAQKTESDISSSMVLASLKRHKYAKWLPTNHQHTIFTSVFIRDCTLVLESQFYWHDLELILIWHRLVRRGQASCGGGRGSPLRPNQHLSTTLTSWRQPNRDCWRLTRFPYPRVFCCRVFLVGLLEDSHLPFSGILSYSNVSIILFIFFNLPVFWCNVFFFFFKTLSCFYWILIYNYPTKCSTVDGWLNIRKEYAFQNSMNIQNCIWAKIKSLVNIHFSNVMCPLQHYIYLLL